MTARIEFGRGVSDWEGTLGVKLKHESDRECSPNHDGFSLHDLSTEGGLPITGTMEDARRLAAALSCMVDSWDLVRKRRLLVQLTAQAGLSDSAPSERVEIDEIYRTLGVPR